MRALTSLVCLAALLSVGAGCEYDLNKVYRFGVPDGGGMPDAAIDGGSKPGLPDKLITLFAEEEFVDDACQACVNKSCAKAEKACREDAACLALTACAAEAVNPDKLSACRTEQAAWCAADIVARGLGGPFYTCAFRDGCPEQCATASDWSCLGKYTWGATAEKSVPIHMRFYDAFDGAPAAGVVVKVCLSSDMECATPASTGQADADGAVTLDLPTPLRSFRGYLRVEGEGWFPTLVQFGYPIARESVVPMPIVTAANVQGSITISGVKPDETRGLLQLRMFGCAGAPMRDVSFSSNKADEASRTWYYDGQTVKFDLAKTTTYGNGGIINVAEGLNEVTAKLGDKVVARTNAPVREGFLTIVVLAPLDSAQSDQ